MILDDYQDAITAPGGSTLAFGPMVLTVESNSPDTDEKERSYGISEVTVGTSDNPDDPLMLMFNFAGTGLQHMVDAADLDVDRDSGTIFATDLEGRKIDVREVTENDGLTFNLGFQFPVKSLQERIMRSYEDVGEYNLFAAIDPDDPEERVEDVGFADDTGLYVRDTGQWFTVPDSDLRFDGKEWVEVRPEFLEEYDKRHRRGDTFKRDDLAKYLASPEGEE